MKYNNAISKILLVYILLIVIHIQVDVFAEEITENTTSSTYSNGEHSQPISEKTPLTYSHYSPGKYILTTKHKIDTIGHNELSGFLITTSNIVIGRNRIGEMSVTINDYKISSIGAKIGNSMQKMADDCNENLSGKSIEVSTKNNKIEVAKTTNAYIKQFCDLYIKLFSIPIPQNINNDVTWSTSVYGSFNQNQTFAVKNTTNGDLVIENTNDDNNSASKFNEKINLQIDSKSLQLRELKIESSYGNNITTENILKYVGQ